jgi:hypothetical protein
MPPYSWIGLESVFWIIFGGLSIALAIILARGSLAHSFSFKKRSEKDLEEEVHHFAGVVSEQNRPIPVFIWLVTVGCFIWAVAYVLFSGAFGL